MRRTFKSARGTISFIVYSQLILYIHCEHFGCAVRRIQMRQVPPAPGVICRGIVSTGIERELRRMYGTTGVSTVRPAAAGPSIIARRRVRAAIAPSVIEMKRVRSRSSRYFGKSGSFGLMRISVPRVWHRCSDSFRTVGTPFPAPEIENFLIYWKLPQKVQLKSKYTMLQARLSQSIACTWQSPYK